MNEIAKVILENEMDIILAHKQSMKLAELAGLSLAAQTTFATAVSEVSRSAVGKENSAQITLLISDKKERLKYIIAVLEDTRADFSELKDEGYNYAKRLVQNINAVTTEAGNKIELNYRLPQPLRIDEALVEKWRSSLNTDPAISPYEEIKRKNTQLLELAGKLRASEQQYVSLTDSLPLMIFSMNKVGDITYANKWLNEYTGKTTEEINSTKWTGIVHPEDFEEVWGNWERKVEEGQTVITMERRLREEKSGEYRWHTGTCIAVTGEDGGVMTWNVFMADIHARKMVEEAFKENIELKEIHAELEEKVALLNRSNQQLEQFAYVASHDLQEPLRKISFYSDYLQSKYSKVIPEQAGMFFNKLIDATDRMKTLIQDILAYSTIRRNDFETIELNEIASETIRDLEISIQERRARITIGALPQIEGNSRQLKQIFENLISNSLKYYKPGFWPVVDISAAVSAGQVILTFKDSGIGFEEQYATRMFDIFQRLHTSDKYTGTGIGLAICKKIVDIHHGSIAAFGKPDEGATILVTLPLTQK